MTASSASAVLGGSSALWVSGNTYRVNDVARSPTDWQTYVRITAGAGTVDPESDSTNWRPNGARPIKSVQRGAISATGLSTTVTITAVNTAKSELRYLGTSSSNGTFGETLVRLALTNSTTITASRDSSSGALTVSWELTEYY